MLLLLLASVLSPEYAYSVGVVVSVSQDPHALRCFEYASNSLNRHRIPKFDHKFIP